jgi:hypothetical protein
MAGSVSSVLEVQAVKVRAVQPAVASFGQIHREIHVSPQSPEAGIEETSDGVHVAGWRRGAGRAAVIIRPPFPRPPLPRPAGGGRPGFGSVYRA